MRVDPALTRTIDHPDPTVQEVLDIWAARFLHSGIPLGDLTGTVTRVQTWSDWGPEWAATARVHEEMGEQALDEGRHISAVGSFINSSKSYHLSYFLSVDDEEAHLRIGRDVASLAPLKRRVDARTLTVMVDPDEARLGVTVRADGGQDAADRPRQQVEMRRGNRYRGGQDGHRASPRSAASIATTRSGRIRHRTGCSVAEKLAGITSPK